MRIYIAGSIKKDPDYAAKFYAAEKYLLCKGYEPVNPAKTYLQDGSYKDYIDSGLKQLMTCDAIYLLRNWQESFGATLEWNYARTVGLKIIYQV